ncbi:hypothetical protein M0805_007129 [Coniferiporia weirii]|nr:hypothetical protein M0805_007129 [Coniferiporia weirii]
MVCASTLLFALALAASRFPQGLAQTGNAAFQWKFGGSFVSTELVQCQNYSIVVSPQDGNNVSDVGVSPYYLIAFKEDGVPTTSYIGSDPNNLSWQVNQANGSTLVLTVADAVGNAGGEAGSLFTVTNGDSSCLPAAPPPSRNLTLVANVSTSDPLLTCQPLGLRVYGGQKPYNISIAALNSPVVTNVTLDPTDDVLTWINRADPNGQLIVSVNDANGWGTSTGIFSTAGSTNYNCTGLVTRSGNSANVDQHPSPPSSSSSSHTATIVAAVVVPVCALLVLAGAFVVWRWRRRRREMMREAEPAFLPDAWTGPVSASGPNVFSALDGGAGTGAGEQPYSPYDSISGSSARESKFARYRDEVSGGRSGRGAEAGADGPQIGMALLSSTHNRSGSGSGPDSGSGSRSGSWSWTGAHGRTTSASKNDLTPTRVLPPGVSREWRISEPDIIIQHRDGGTVTEIPPPYVDHGLSAGGGGSGGGGFEGAGAGAGASAGDGPSSTAGPGPSGVRHGAHGPSHLGTSGDGSLLL